jgi:uncharacterized membrane protein
MYIHLNVLFHAAIVNILYNQVSELKIAITKKTCKQNAPTGDKTSVSDSPLCDHRLANAVAVKDNNIGSKILKQQKQFLHQQIQCTMYKHTTHTHTHKMGD